ncbi:MAG: antitoxin family protein [Chloroflexi bacterium]|nr:antitoxin family protein [Chloroflexota bacterium]
MTRIFKATYASGVLTPSEPLGIEEGTEVTLSIDDAPVISPSRKPSPCSAWKIISEGPAQRLFKSAKEVDDYLAEERASWER